MNKDMSKEILEAINVSHSYGNQKYGSGDKDVGFFNDQQLHSISHDPHGELKRVPPAAVEHLKTIHHKKYSEQTSGLALDIGPFSVSRVRGTYNGHTTDFTLHHKSKGQVGGHFVTVHGSSLRASGTRHATQRATDHVADMLANHTKVTWSKGRESSIKKKADNKSYQTFKDED